MSYMMGTERVGLVHVKGWSRVFFASKTHQSARQVQKSSVGEEVDLLFQRLPEN